MMRLFNAFSYNSELEYIGIFKLAFIFQELTQELSVK